MRLGIIGTSFGKRHAEIFQKLPDVEVVGILGKDEQKTKAVARTLDITGFVDIKELLETPEIDAIDVCSPTNLHINHVTAALEHGKHVFCETPVSYKLEEAEKMARLAASTDRLLMVALYSRFVSEYKYIHDTITAGHLGKPNAIFINRRTPAVWGTWDDNFILNLMLHDIDYLYWTLGKPLAVTSRALIDANNHWQHVFIMVEHEHSNALIEGCGIMPPSFPFSTSLRVVCESGAIDLDWRWGGTAPISELTLYPSNGEPELLSIPGYDPYEAECRYFIDSILGKSDPELLGIDSAVGSLSVALAARKSLEENGSRVNL
jgi:predicted dehydrogenase